MPTVLQCIQPLGGWTVWHCCMPLQAVALQNHACQELRCLQCNAYAFELPVRLPCLTFRSSLPAAKQLTPLQDLGVGISTCSDLICGPTGTINAPQPGQGIPVPQALQTQQQLQQQTAQQGDPEEGAEADSQAFDRFISASTQDVAPSPEVIREALLQVCSASLHERLCTAGLLKTAWV